MPGKGVRLGVAQARTIYGLLDRMEWSLSGRVGEIRKTRKRIEEARGWLDKALIEAGDPGIDPYGDGRCPFHSRAWGCRCELPAGHDGEMCESQGDGFRGGHIP